MKKRFVTTLLSLIACIACIIGFAACGKNDKENSGENGRTDVNDSVAVTGVTLNQRGLTLDIGDEETLTATVKPDNATSKNVIWTSSAPAVATVDTTGTVKAIAEGSATITATAGGKSATCSVTVNAEAGNNLSVTGKTFIFSDLTLSFDDTVTESTKDMYNNTYEQLKAPYVGATIAFGENGVLTMTTRGNPLQGTYTQDGTNLVLTVNNAPMPFVLNGDTISYTFVVSGVSQIRTYTLQA